MPPSAWHSCRDAALFPNYFGQTCYTPLLVALFRACRARLWLNVSYSHRHLFTIRLINIHDVSGYSWQHQIHRQHAVGTDSTVTQLLKLQIGNVHTISAAQRVIGTKYWVTRSGKDVNSRIQRTPDNATNKPCTANTLTSAEGSTPSTFGRPMLVVNR